MGFCLERALQLDDEGVGYLLQNLLLGLDVLNLFQPNNFSLFQHFEGHRLGFFVVFELDESNSAESSGS